MGLLELTYFWNGLYAQLIPNSDYIGAVGNFIAAILQTAGLYAQTDVLLFYRDALESLAGLLFTFSIIGAITVAAVFGNYKGAGYLLIGPLLFYGMLTGLTTAKPTAVQNGSRLEEGVEKLQQSMLSVYLDGSDIYTREIQLSWFFVMFDNLVTNVAQNVISVLIDEENREDIVAVARERAFTELMGAQNADRNLYELTSMALVGECSSVMGKYLQAGQPGIRDAEEGTEKAQLRDDLIKKANQDIHINNINIPKDLLKRLGSAVDQERLNQVQLTSGNAAEQWQQIINKPVHSCFDVWTFTRILTHIHAADRISEIRNRENTDPSAPEVPWEQVAVDLESTLGATVDESERAQAMMEVVSANIFQNALTRTNHAKLMNKINSHAGFNTDGQLFDDVFAGYYSIEGQGALARLAMFTGVIPYLQGLFLFILSAAFPFFCVFLVMPGRVSSFLTWMWLWVWVKSWDVGFAAIHVLRDILWEWLGKTAAPYLTTGIPNTELPDSLAAQAGNISIQTNYAALNWSDPSAVFHAVLRADPMANVATYHILISLVTVSVPFLTAHLCRGAGQVFSAFQGSFEGISDNFGRTYNNRMEQRSANAMNDVLNQAASAYALNKTMQFIKNESKNEGEAKIARDHIEALHRGGKNLDYGQRGDGTLAAAAGAYYMAQRAEFTWSNEAMDMQKTRGMFTARQSLWDSGVGQNNLSGWDSMQMAISDLGRSPLQAGSHPGGALQPGIKGSEGTGGYAGGQSEAFGAGKITGGPGEEGGGGGGD